MATPDRLAAEVLVAAEVPVEQERAIVLAFGDLGVAARARAVPTRRGAAELQWLVLAALPLQAFLSGLGSSLADGASKGLKRLVGRVLGSRPEPAPHVLVLQDAETRLQVVLEPDLPTEAYRALLRLDLSAFRAGPLHYDRHGGRWRSELDESRQRQAPPEDREPA